MKKFLLVVGLLMLGSKAHAYQEVVEVYRSSATVGGVACSTGTPTARFGSCGLAYEEMGSGENRAAIRSQNHDASNDVYIGFSTQMSTDTNNPAHLGEVLQEGGGNAVYQVGKSVEIYCQAADAAGAAGVVITGSQYGYK